MFYFVVRHLRWAARVPGFPHLFDGLLLARTWLFQQARIGAMELLEAEALRLPGVRLKVHRFGGIEFVEKAGYELGHLHGHGLLDVCVGREAATVLLSSGRVLHHHVFPCSKWVSYQIQRREDVPMALELLKLAQTRLADHVASISPTTPLDY